MTMTLVETITVGSGGAASMEFTGIPGTGKDLLLVLSARTSTGTNIRAVSMTLNNDTATNYSRLRLYGDGSSVSTSGPHSEAVLEPGYVNAAGTTANSFGSLSLYISNYTSTASKSISTDSVTETNGTAGYQALYANSWNNAATVASMQIDVTDDFVEHSSASLYIIS